MTEKIDFEKVPHNYAMCLNAQCALSSTCLRYLAAESVPDTLITCNIISPKYLANTKGKCPQYRSSQKVIYAKGFLRMLGDIPLKQVKKVQGELITLLGQRTYYRCRKGERLLSPTEQKQIKSIVHQCDISTPIDFDSYEEDSDW